MIEGLKVTVKGAELKELCFNRANHHAGRAAVYEGQVQAMVDNNIEATGNTGGDPIKALRDKQSQHACQCEELTFIAEHIDLTESYLLEDRDLQRLGIVSQRHYF